MNYQKLFNYMHEEHGVILLETDLQAIVRIVEEMEETE
jgi:ribulose-5-phosphate 4-epimerase/fuculose-1-phosphate aldolase